MNQASGKKISQMISSPTIPSTARFPFVSEGTNYQITKENFLNQVSASQAIRVIDSNGDTHNIPVVVV